MKRWPIRPLGEIGELRGGGTPSRKVPEYFRGDIPWITGADVTELYVSKAREFITNEAIDNSTTTLLPKNTVLVVSRTGVGKIGIAATRLCISQDLTGIICTDAVLPEYLARYLLARTNQLRGGAQGATILGITRDFLKRVQIPVPPLAEQERIVRILDEAEELRRLRRQADRRTADLIPAIFQEMFCGIGGQAGTWPLNFVAELAEKRPGSIRTGPFGSDLLHSEFVEKGVPVLGIDNVVENRFRWTKPRCISAEKYDGFRRFRVFPGDVLVTIMGTVGRACVTPDDLPECMSTKHLCAISVDHTSIDPTYLWGAFRFDAGVRQQTRVVSRGAIMEGWNSTIIKRLSVRVPPLALQRQFAARVGEVCAMEEKQAASRERLDDFFQSLLYRAFQGEL